MEYARNGGLERWLAPRLVRSFVRKGEARQKGRERSLLAFPACVHGTKRRSFPSFPPPPSWLMWYSLRISCQTDRLAHLVLARHLLAVPLSSLFILCGIGEDRLRRRGREGHTKRAPLLPPPPIPSDLSLPPYVDDVMAIFSHPSLRRRPTLEIAPAATWLAQAAAATEAKGVFGIGPKRTKCIPFPSFRFLFCPLLPFPSGPL